MLRHNALLSTAIWLASILPTVERAAAYQEIAQSETVRSALVTAIKSEIVIDGALEEPAWGSASRIGDLIQREPRNGQRPTEETDVMLLHDANYLYVGVICYDSEPQKVVGTQMARDSVLTSDDRVTIVLDTYRDQRNAFYFSTNAVGALVDGLIFANGQTAAEWDGIWRVRTRRTDRGWTAEFAIPFKTLSFPAQRTIWGFNFARNISRKLEEDRWSGYRLQTQLFQVSEAGEISFPGEMTQASVSTCAPSLLVVGCTLARLGMTSPAANRDSICSTTSRRI